MRAPYGASLLIRWAGHGLLAAMIVTASGCGPLTGFARNRFRADAPPIVVKGYRLPQSGFPRNRPMVGMHRRDITPPAGYPTGGHGPAGGFARAYWNRLYARAFVFSDADGNPLILVSADLFAIPGGLTAQVSREVALRWRSQGIAIPPEAIIIAATHTHHSPGNYLTAAVYNEFGSKYAGFDRPLFNFLAREIAAAINAAIEDGMRNGSATLTLHTGRIGGMLTLNRSPLTFLANWNARELLGRLQNPPVHPCVPVGERGEARENGWDLPECPRRRAVDRTMTVLTIKRGGERAGALVFFAVHPTVLYHDAPLYNSDFVGMAVSNLERYWYVRASSASPVVGFFNGPSGDIVATRGLRDMRDVQRAARQFRAAVEAVTTRPDSVPVSLGPIRSRRGLLRPGVRYERARPPTPLAPIQLPESPAFGAAALGGGEDDRTVLHRFGWEEGRRSVPSRGQGLKLPALDSDLLAIKATEEFAPKEAFPSELPITLSSLGPLRLAALPVEVSTAQGMAIRDALDAPTRLEIVTVANEYASYAATEDEYAVQDYMAASTLLGPREGAALIWALRCLNDGTLVDYGCRQLHRDNPGYVPARMYEPGKPPDRQKTATRFGPSRVGEPLGAPDDEFHRIVRDNREAPVRNLPYFEWMETIRSPVDEFAATARRSVQMLECKGGVWIQREVPGDFLVPDNDAGANFLTVLRRGKQSRSRADEERRWAVIWLAPVLEDVVPPGRYKFRVTVQRDRTVNDVHDSMPFRVELRPTYRRENRIERDPSPPPDHAARC